MTSSNDSFGYFGSHSKPSDGKCILIILHPMGKLDDPKSSPFWTEVPQFPSCCSDGQTTEDAITNTKAAVYEFINNGLGIDKLKSCFKVEIAF